MTRHDFLSAGVKLLGLCLLALGFIGAGRHGIAAYTAHAAFTHYPEPWISTNVPAQLRTEILNQNKSTRDMEKFTLRVQRLSGLQNLAWSLVQAIVGALLVWGDRWVVRVIDPGGARAGGG
jgi:hypothetical protein